MILGRSDSQAGERGLILVEALIAAAIVAAMMGLLFQVIGETQTAERRMRQARVANMVAQSVLARVGTEIAVTSGVIDGEADGYAWRVAMEPIRREGAAALTATPVFDVTVAVSAASGGKPLLTLHTARLGS